MVSTDMYRAWVELALLNEGMGVQHTVGIANVFIAIRPNVVSTNAYRTWVALALLNGALGVQRTADIANVFIAIHPKVVSTNMYRAWLVLASPDEGILLCCLLATAFGRHGGE